MGQLWRLKSFCLDDNLYTMANEPVNPHDAFFKQYLSRPQVAADFLRRQLPADVVALLDLTQLALAKDSFVDERLRGSTELAERPL